MEKIRLYGFNNLTKSLSFNIYDVCYAVSEEDKKKYIEYIDEQYNSTRLTNILIEITNIIGANILSISKQDYQPQGASVNFLITEEKLDDTLIDPSCNKGEICLDYTNVIAHMDKSHISVHTYPEYHPDKGIMTFRVDLDVSTCGKISPLKALNYLFDKFDSDIVICDYKIRGFTRDIDGRKLFKDHDINSIQDFISQENKDKYNMIDINIYEENIFHTKMLIKDLVLDNYLFEKSEKDLTEDEKEDILYKLNMEMHEIYYGKNY